MNCLKLNEIKAGVPVGTPTPERQQHGNIGRWVEEEMKKQGWELTAGKGVDIPGYGIEVKTRKSESNSYHTVGSQTVEELISTEYKSSVIREKFQQQYRVYYSDENQVVVSEGLLDLSSDYIQDRIRDAYEAGRKRIIENEARGIRPSYVKGTIFGHFELSQDKGSYRFRISNRSMKCIETPSKTAKLFSKFFEE